MDTESWRDEQRKLREAVRGGRNHELRNPAPIAAQAVEPSRVQPPDLLATPIVSARGSAGRLIVAAKRMLRRLLAPFVLEPQTKFNQAVSAELAEQRAQLAALAARQQSGATDVAHSPLDYFAFEEKFRGSSEAIAARQAEYVPYLTGRGEVLDIGCGRGELLALLKEGRVSARGVDLDEDMVARCREQGLSAERADALEYLERQPDGFFGGVFMSHVAEHLTSDYLAMLLDAVGRKTSRDAVLIVETLNPESLPVLTRWFWLDPTHVRLVHPETLQYLAEQAGFRVEAVQFRNEPREDERFPRLQPADAADQGFAAQFNRAVDLLNERLSGSLDYVVVCTNQA